MSGFLADADSTLIQATTTTSNTAVFTSGPATFNVTNVGTNPVKIGLSQGDGSAFGNVVVPGGWPMTLQCANPERTPGTVYVIATAIGGSANVYVTSGFEV